MTAAAHEYESVLMAQLDPDADAETEAGPDDADGICCRERRAFCPAGLRSGETAGGCSSATGSSIGRSSCISRNSSSRSKGQQLRMLQHQVPALQLILPASTVNLHVG